MEGEGCVFAGMDCARVQWVAKRPPQLALLSCATLVVASFA